jgi:hypothetical protein
VTEISIFHDGGENEPEQPTQIASASRAKVGESPKNGNNRTCVEARLSHHHDTKTVFIKMLIANFPPKK